MKFFLNPGHCPDIVNGIMADSGAVNTVYDLKEAVVARDICRHLRFFLESAGHKVFVLQSNNLRNGWDDDLSYPCIVDEANKYGADFSISIHLNAFNGMAKGTETLVFSRNSGADRMAQCIQKAIVSEIGTVDRGVKYEEDKERGKRLSFIMKTDMPAILVECCFIDNANDVETIMNNGEINYAKAIFDGIDEYVRRICNA